MNSYFAMLVIHVTRQAGNTVEHLLLGGLACLALLFAGVSPFAAVLLVAALAAAREFAWQLPFEDHWHFKLADRGWDITEFAVGALVAALLALAFSRFLSRTAGPIARQ